MAKWQALSPLLSNAFVWTKTRIYAKDHPETWFLSARSYPKSADRETIGKTLSGIHSKYVLFLVDESGDIPVEVLKAAEQAVGETRARGGFVKILQAGNPISKHGMLYAASMSKQWHVIRITGDPNDPNRSPRIDAEWAQSQIDEYGRNDSWVKSYILGQFPEGSIDSLLSISEVEEAMDRHLKEDAYNRFQKKLGIDVARFGMDSTVIFPRQGRAAFNYVSMRGATTNEIAARVMMAKSRWQSDVEMVDDTGGFGAGVIDSLVVTGISALGVNFAGKPMDNRYFNKRAEMWFLMAKWVKEGGALPKCNQLKKELTSVKYFLNGGRLQLESKDQIKKRLGFSPDISDALCLTFATPDMYKENEMFFNQGNNYKSDYDPFKGM